VGARLAPPTGVKPPARPRAVRIGMTDPDGPLARHLRDLVHESDIPVSRFVPIGGEEDAGRLSEVDGEPEYRVAPSRETIGDLDLLVLGGSDVDAEALKLARENDVAVFDASAAPPAALGCAFLIAACAPASAAFTLLLPAAEAGTRGIQELFQQTSDALNFRDTAADVFGGRLAFNVFRDARTEAADRNIAAYLAERFPACRSSVIAARAALFHGYSGSAELRFGDPAGAKAGAAALRRDGGIAVSARPGGASPAAAVAEAGVRIDPPIVEGDRLTVWFAFDGLTLAARAALDPVRALLAG
jgi:hypothetical protein